MTSKWIVLALGVPALALGGYAVRDDLLPAVSAGPTANAAAPVAAGAPLASAAPVALAVPVAAGGDAVAHAYAELEGQLRKQPKDARALVLKARMDVQAERWEMAAAGFQKALDIAPKVARDAGVWAEYAEARGMAQGGTLLGPAMELVDRALALDPAHPQALDLAGSAAWERRDFSAAVGYWKRLLQQIPPSDGRHAELSMAIERAQQNAKFELPSTARR